MADINFKYKKGLTGQSVISGFKGIIIARADHIFGCNRYLLAPKVNKDGELSDGYWFDEDEIKILKVKSILGNDKKTGGPPSKLK